MKVGGSPLPGVGFGLGVRVQLADKPDHAAGEYSWGGAADTAFWIAPRSELVVIVLQQLQPATSELQLALRPVIYAAMRNEPLGGKRNPTARRRTKCRCT